MRTVDNKRQEKVRLGMLLNFAGQCHLYHECLFTGRTMASIARERGVSRESIRHRVDAYATRNGLPKISDLRKINMNDSGRECSRCGIWKLWDKYYTNQYGPGGHKSACKDCESGPKKTRPTTVQRFMDKWQENENNCWMWLGAKSKGNYPKFFVSSERGYVYAYRWSYESFIGPIPIDQRVIRTCNDVLCVNPAHLTLANHSQIRRRTIMGEQKSIHH